LIATLKKEFPDLEIGISDHTQTPFSSVIAAAMGATIIEKHYTVDKTLGMSADHWFSVDPQELKMIVYGCEYVRILKGSSEKKVFDCEKETRLYDKRSIVSKVDIKKGDIISEDMITYKRPGTGLAPKFKNQVIGQKAKTDIIKDTPITSENI
jgi:N-acetylneuraminate synthase